MQNPSTQIKSCGHGGEQPGTNTGVGATGVGATGTGVGATGVGSDTGVGPGPGPP